MSQVTVICCSCGDLFSPDPDNHNLLCIEAEPVSEFYVCDECLARECLEGEDMLAIN